MPYDEHFVAPMREELTRLGVRELRTVSDVDAQLKDALGSLFSRQPEPMLGLDISSSSERHLTHIFRG